MGNSLGFLLVVSCLLGNTKLPWRQTGLCGQLIGVFLMISVVKLEAPPEKKKTLTYIIKVYLKASSEKKINGVYSAFKQVQNGKLILCFGGLSVKGKIN